MPPRDTVHSPTIQSRDVELDGSVRGFLAMPTVADWRSGVVVIAGRDGLDADTRATCAGLAMAGHGALALDLALSCLSGSHRLSPGASAGLDRLTAAVAKGVLFLRGHRPAPSRLGVVGYGVGGLVALAAGYRCQVGAAVSFYGDGPMRLRANLTQIIDKPKRHAASFLCLVGGEDPDVSPADLGALRDHLDGFGMRHTLIIYPRTKANFARTDGPSYRPKEALDAWQRLLDALATAPRQRHRFRPKTRPPTGAPTCDTPSVD